MHSTVGARDETQWKVCGVTPQDPKTQEWRDRHYGAVRSEQKSEQTEWPDCGKHLTVTTTRNIICILVLPLYNLWLHVNFGQKPNCSNLRSLLDMRSPLQLFLQIMFSSATFDSCDHRVSDGTQSATKMTRGVTCRVVAERKPNEC